MYKCVIDHKKCVCVLSTLICRTCFAA